MALGDIVKGVTGLKDCATNQSVDVGFEGQFTTPDGWNGPDTQPPNPGYEAGIYWPNNMEINGLQCNTGILPAGELDSVVQSSRRPYQFIRSGYFKWVASIE